MVYKPDDLKDTSEVDPKDSDYFLVTVTDLNPGDEYKFQFAWIYTDRASIADDKWSITKVVTASTEAAPKPPQFLDTDLTANTEKIFVQWNGVDEDGDPYKGIDRVEVFIDGGEFDPELPVTSFKVATKKSITVTGAEYTVTLKAVTALGTYSDPSDAQTVTVDAQAGEVIEDPTNPNGFTLTRILGGLELAWAGTYANGTFSGFRAIEVFVGNSATATSGTYISAGVLTGDQVVNKIVIPVDGTYCRYNQPVYIHARAVNKNGEFGTLQQNVASNNDGARSAISSDLANDIITNEKLVNDAISSAKIATGAITGTKISDNAIESSKIVANAITADKIVSSAITADKIAANAITATKIKAGEIDVTKLSAGTISVDNLEAGNISSTSYIRAGTESSARVEISSSAVGGVLAGLHIYASDGTAILKAPLTGGLEITGKITATSGNISGTMSVDGQLNVGNAIIKSASGSFSITDATGGYGVISTADAGRILLGHLTEGVGRQVEAARSAQIAGSENRNSGGLRNMYTITESGYYSSIYLSDRSANGDVLLIWDPTS
jgi:hypothetical protein